MEPLSVGFSQSLPFPNNPKTHKPIFLLSNQFFKCNPHDTRFRFLKKITHLSNARSTLNLSARFSNLSSNHLPLLRSSPFHHFFLKQACFPLLFMGFSFPLSSFASEVAVPAEELSNKINLEAILVSIDDFFNRNPFFVAGVTFIWLVVIPLTEEFLQKYKFILAIDAFRKLRDDSNCQLIDIRDRKSIRYLNSPKLKMLNKSVVQVEFVEDREEDFVKEVVQKFEDPATTTICILDNFDGNSMKVAELLVKNGFKEAYAIRGGLRGKNGWQEIQESLLPPPVHVYPRKKVKKVRTLEMVLSENNQPSSDTSLSVSSKQSENGYVVNSAETNPKTKHSSRSSSPYPNYPDLKPPSSPTPSKP